MRFYTFAVGFVVCILAVACSSGGNIDPISSPIPDQGITSSAQETQPSGAHYTWGLWSISIDPETMTAAIRPLRGVDFTCNVTQFMQPPSSPTEMVSIALLGGSDPSSGYFEMDITLRHPFPGLSQFRGFDVRGIMISNGSMTSDHDSSATYQGPDDAQLLNADGHTRWWNPTEFTSYETIFGFTQGSLAPPLFPTATLNGHKYFSEGLAYEEYLWELDPDSRGTFEVVPGTYTRAYFIQFAMDGDKPDFTFNYAIDASWEPPDPLGYPDYDIEYFSLSANAQEPYCLIVLDNGSTAYYEDPGSSGGELNLAIRVYDWQSVENPDGVPGELNAIWLESPVLTTPIDVLPTATVLPDGPTSSIFEVSLGSLNLTKSGLEPLLVFAEASDSFGYQPQIGGGDAFDYPDAPLGSYLLTNVLISDTGGNPPIVTAIDPNHAYSGQLLIDVEVSGQNFQNGAQVELRHDDWPTIEADNEVTQPGGTMIICDIDLDLAAEGDWDVAVINPDLLEGVLEDGFHVDCAEDVHSYEDVHLLTGGLYWNYCQRGDLTILETGTYAGQCVLKRQYATDAPCTGYYVRFDPDNPSDTEAFDYFNLPGRVDSEWAYVTMTAQIDQNPVNGHMAVVNGRMFDYVQIVDQDGIHLEDIIITDPLTEFDELPIAAGVDFDVDGDLWIATNVRGVIISGDVTNAVWQLRHYELQASSPYYVETLADRLEINDDLTDPVNGHMWDLSDIAISYSEDCLIIFSIGFGGGARGWFVKYDISTSPPTHVAGVNLLSSLSLCSNPYGVSRCDIEFDHSDQSVENCRLLVMYQAWDGEVQVHLMRLDTDLNILNDEIVGPPLGPWYAPHAIAINTDPDLRNLISIDMSGSAPYNDFSYWTMPTSGW